MSDQFVAEIRICPYNFAPTGWAFCNGQILPIAQNTALFSLLGITYGGDGKSTFGLPNLQGRAAMHPGQGQGLSLHDLGEVGGDATVTLNLSEIPVHNHGPLNVHDAAGTSGDPDPSRNLAIAPSNIYGPATKLVPMGDTVGGGDAHENRQPYLALNFIIALQGIFPQREP
jgi:microcystin-dependent protein